MEPHGFFALFNEVEKLLDKACDELSPENFERFKVAVKQLVDAYE